MGQATEGLISLMGTALLCSAVEETQGITCSVRPNCSLSTTQQILLFEYSKPALNRLAQQNLHVRLLILALYFPFRNLAMEEHCPLSSTIPVAVTHHWHLVWIFPPSGVNCSTTDKEEHNIRAVLALDKGCRDKTRGTVLTCQRGD